MMTDSSRLVEAAEAAINAGRLEQAFTTLQGVIQREPQYLPAYMALGQLLFLNKDFVMAAGCYHTVLAADPGAVAARVLLAMACFNAGDAIAAQQHAKLATLHPSLAAAEHGNLSALYLDLGRFREALRHAEAALRIGPEVAEYHCRRGTALLALGRYIDGWPEYEWRRNMSVAVLQAGQWSDATATVETLYGIAPDKPLWDGRPVDHLVVHHEHGFGDTLQWCRFVPLAAKRCVRVSMIVPTAMLGLMRDSFVADTLVISDTLPATYDAYIWMDSLPRLFNAGVTQTANTPYLRASATDWPTRLARYGQPQRPRIGLVWAGRPGLHTDRWRSIPFDQLDSILNLSANFFSLQKGRDEIRADPRLHDLGPHLTTWQDTARVITALDLIISVDTSTVHLAGAMGKPVWLLNRYNTCWRWLLHRSTCPWYPSMRIFRQPTIGDWSRVMAEVATALRYWLRTTERDRHDI